MSEESKGIKLASGVKISYGNVLTALAMAGAFLVYLNGFDNQIIANANASETNAQEIEHQRELQQQENKHIREKLDKIEGLLERLADS